MHRLRMRFPQSRAGFSLIELVIVVAILAIIGAIAIPRMSRGASGAADSSLRQNLVVMRKAIEMYRSEHGGLVPDEDLTFAAQLTMYSDAAGNTSATRDATHRFGPYLHQIPRLPVGKNAGSNEIRDGGSPGDGDEGWFYDKDTGEIFANTKDAELDRDGTPYNQY